VARFDTCLYVRYAEWLGLPVTDDAAAVSFDPRSQTLTAGPVTMRVKQGDITREKADAIVNSTNEHVDMTGGTNYFHFVVT